MGALDDYEYSLFFVDKQTAEYYGSLGYFPTASAFAEGGYEAKSSPFAPSVAERIVAGLK